jgi:hypothetical protein
MDQYDDDFEAEFESHSNSKVTKSILQKDFKKCQANPEFES